MPRRNTIVKNNSHRLLATPGCVDLHFHGAFGIDLMTAPPSALTELAERLFQGGVTAFCPTTLSAPAESLAETVRSLGPWIRNQWNPSKKSRAPQKAIPLGIHLEGPFIHPDSRGAHPAGAIRSLELSELEKLWELSANTLKILTVAPETVSDLKKLSAWCRKRKITLSLGHSRATEAQAREAFEAGFSGVTHAWNALPFHHRAPGPLGAALGRKNVHVEIIVDQVHVAPTLIDWTRKLHENQPLCYVSDCVPAAETAQNGQVGPWVSFGSLKIRQENGACRLDNGTLAGGGLLLSKMIGHFLQEKADSNRPALKKLLKEHSRHWSKDPLRALLLPAKLQKQACFHSIQWHLKDGQLLAHPKGLPLTQP